MTPFSDELPECRHRVRTVEARDGQTGRSLGNVHCCDLVDRALGWHALQGPGLCVSCLAERGARSSVRTRSVATERDPEPPRADSPTALGRIVRTILIKTIAAGVADSEHRKWKRQGLAQIMARAVLLGVSREDVVAAMAFSVEYKRQSPASVWRLTQDADSILRQSGSYLIERDGDQVGDRANQPENREKTAAGQESPGSEPAA